MKNKLLPIFVGIFLASTVVFSQEKCGTYEGSLEDQIQKYPDFYQGLEKQNKELEVEHKEALKKLAFHKTEGGKKIIPVVVHNIYNSDGGYLSDLQIQAAIDALNKNINGQSDKLLEMYQGQYIKTPDIFAAVRGVANVEFRLAKLAPTCESCPPNYTTGINRVYSDLTNVPENRDEVKLLSYWSSYKYFNIWTVRSFSQGGLLGYAQFPYSGLMSTDGVVLLANEMNDPTSTTLTHEAGHWLNLIHIWGDANCGDDEVKDTPVQKYDNNGASESSPTPNGHPKGNPTNFPYHVGLWENGGEWGCQADSLNPAGEMFMNFMSYTTDAFATMFSAGQIERINATLEGEIDEETGLSGIGYREHMWSTENIIATGTSDGYINLNDSCNAKYDFVERFGNNSSCLGTANTFKSNSNYIDLDVTSAIWEFGNADSVWSDTSDYSSSLVLGHYKQHEFQHSGEYDITFIVKYDEVRQVRVSDSTKLIEPWDGPLIQEINTLIVQGTQEELIAMGVDPSDITEHIDYDGYSLNSFWRSNQSNTDSILDASFINTLESDSTINPINIYIDGSPITGTFPDSVLLDNVDSIWMYIDGDNLTSQDLVLLNNADSTWTTDINIGYLNSIVDYSFYYDTTVLNILTFIDSTFLSSADSAWLDGADSSWSVDGVLASDSIRIYFAQFNIDSTITISINIDTTSLSASELLMFNDADSVWSDTLVVGSVDTIRTYHAQYTYTLYNGYYADTLFYRGELEETSYIAEYRSSCTSAIIKEKYITIGESQATNAVYPYIYSFENENDLNEDWVLTQPQSIDNEWVFLPSETTIWQWTNQVANDGGASIMINKDNLFTGSTEIISQAYDLSNFPSDTAAIKFSWSGAAVNNNPVNELKVSYSTNCGEDWSALGTIGAIESASAGMFLTSFQPNLTQWNDTIMTKVGLSNDNVMFKFEYVVNGNSNNFYLDNIMIGEQSELLIIEDDATNSRLSIFPNPTEGNTTIAIEYLADKNIEVSLINILGTEVDKLYNGNIISNYHIIDADLSNLEKGIYFVKVVANGNIVVTDKLILSK